jgi:hypothetical protein
LRFGVQVVSSALMDGKADVDRIRLVDVGPDEELTLSVT